MYLPKEYSLDPLKRHWKVITMKSTGSGLLDEKSHFGFMKIAEPGEIFSGSYIGFKTDSKSKSESLYSYLQTDVVNYLLGIRKITRYIRKYM